MTALMITTMSLLSTPNVAFSESIYDINIPSGSADVGAPFHWVSEKDGNALGFIEIVINDTIYWKNGDTTFHTVTSGTPKAGPDGIFDSGMISPGGLFAQKFTEMGEFSYYCTLHPWRTGLVSVGSGYSILPNVGADFGDRENVFNLEYDFNRVVNRASIDENTNSITFDLRGNTINDDNTLTLFLPADLISGISSVSIDGVTTEKFTQELEDDTTALTVSNVPPYAKSVTITGATIVPEFGTTTAAAIILGVAIILLIVPISINSKLRIVPTRLTQ